jgi:hypothetical protein
MNVQVSRARQIARGVLALLLAGLFLSVLAEPAAAAHTAPWRWKRVAGSLSWSGGLPFAQQQELTLYCPAGYRPVFMEWSGVGGNGFVVQANYVDYSGNWGHLLISYPAFLPQSRLEATLNCVHGDDIGAVTTAGVTLGRSGTRSGGYVTCPNGWGPLSFGADWEGFDASKRIDFTAPTENGWYATGYDGESNSHLYLEVHCVSTAVLAGAVLADNQATGLAGQDVSLTATCPAGTRAAGTGAFQYNVGGSVDPFDVTQGTVHTTMALIAAGSWGSRVHAMMPSSGGLTWLVARAWCVPAATPTLTVSPPPSDVHVPTVSYSFSATDPAGEALHYSCALDTDNAPCDPGTTNTISNLALGPHTLTIQVLNDSFMPDAESHDFWVSTAPPAPTMSGTIPQAASASVNFTSSGDGASPITGYTAECASTDGGVSSTASGPTSPLSVPGLTAGRHYHCRVRATNGVGDGPFSTYGDLVLVGGTPAGPIVTGSTPSPGSVSVAFTPGADSGSPATAFMVECISTDGGATGTTPGSESPIAVSGLTNGRYYKCHVRATNAVGAGPYGGYGPTVLVADVPAGPSVTGGTVAPGQIAVAFTPGPDGGSAVTEYVAVCTSTDGGAAGTASGGASPIVVGPLTRGRQYRCQVRATNAAGTGTFGAEGPAVTMPDVPGRPKVTLSQPLSPKKLKVAAVVVGNGGSKVTSYRVVCTSANGGKRGTATGPRSPLRIKGLTPGKVYRCKVRASNVLGPGAWSRKGPKVRLPVARGSISSPSEHRPQHQGQQQRRAAEDRGPQGGVPQRGEGVDLGLRSTGAGVLVAGGSGVGDLAVGVRAHRPGQGLHRLHDTDTGQLRRVVQRARGRDEESRGDLRGVVVREP